MISTIVYASTVSRVTNGVTIAVGNAGPTGGMTLFGVGTGTQYALGGAVGANGVHALLRFGTGDVIPSTVTIVEAKLSVKTNMTSTPSAGFDVYGSSFGAALELADYNRANTNTSSLNLGKIQQIIAGGSSIPSGTVHNSVYIPSVYIGQGAGNFLDLEIRPNVSGIPAATHTTYLHGPEAVATADRPQVSIIALTDAEAVIDETYYNVGINDESYVAIGRETTRGVPVKASFYLPMVSSGLDVAAVNLISEQRTRDRMGPRTAAVGGVGAAGPVAIEMTPESLDYVFGAFFKQYGTTTDLGNGVYEREYRIAKSRECGTYTVVQRKGSLVEVFPGSRFDSLAFAMPQGANVSIAMGVMGQTPILVDNNAADYVNGDRNLVLTTATTDLSPQMTSVSLLADMADGTYGGAEFDELSFLIGQNISMENGYTRERGPTDSTVGKFGGSISGRMTFKSPQFYREHMGIDHRKFPATPKKTITYRNFTLNFEGSAGEATQQVKFIFTKTTSINLQTPIEANDGTIKQPFSLLAFTESTYNGLRIITRNSITDALLLPLTNYITVLPARS